MLYSTLSPRKQAHGLITEFWTFAIFSISKQIPFISPWAYKTFSPITHVHGGWSTFIGESINTQVEPDNVHDKYAVKVLKKEAVVAHVPRDISRYCSFVFNSGGTMSGIVNGDREKRR